MSDESAPSPTATIDFPRIAQITRATVTKDRMVFEVQAPDEASAPMYADTLRNKLRYHFRTTQVGFYKDDVFPVEVALERQDKTKVMVTYTPVRKSDLRVGSPTDPLIEAFEEAHKSLDILEHGRMGIHTNAAVADNIMDAVNKFRELNGVGAKRVPRQRSDEPQGGRSR